MRRTASLHLSCSWRQRSKLSCCRHCPSFQIPFVCIFVYSKSTKARTCRQAAFFSHSHSVLSPQSPLINEVASQVMLIDLPLCFLPLFSKVQLHSSTAIHHWNEAGCGAKLNVPISISSREPVQGTEVTVVEIG